MEHSADSTPRVMDNTHADGIWFCSWENSLLLLLTAGGRKKTHQVLENLLVQNETESHTLQISAAESSAVFFYVIFFSFFLIHLFVYTFAVLLFTTIIKSFFFFFPVKHLGI